MVIQILQELEIQHQLTLELEVVEVIMMLQVVLENLV